MLRRAAICLVAVVVPAAGGCGTFFNLIPEPHKMRAPGPRPLKVYGGVENSAFFAWTGLTEPFTKSDVTVANRILATPYCWSLAAWAAAVDMPLSAVADTLTLPITIPAALARERDKHESAPEPTDPPAKPFSPP
jgi:uncharacterized protein YceK